MKGPAPSLEWCRAFFSIDCSYRFYTWCLSEAVIGKSFIYEFPGQVVFVGIELQGKGEIAWLLWKNPLTVNHQFDDFIVCLLHTLAC